MSLIKINKFKYFYYLIIILVKLILVDLIIFNLTEFLISKSSL